jgi:D-alanine transaminase
VNETPFTVDEMLNAKEVLISSSSAPGLRCVEIDGKSVGRQAPEIVTALQKWVKDEIFAATEAD